MSGTTPAAPLPLEGRGKGWGNKDQPSSLRQPTKAARKASKQLRRRTTEAEKELWWHIRRKLPLDRTHFRRQVAIGPYVVDFCCHRQRLVIELDGGQHADEPNLAADRERDAFLRERGYRVRRFWNADVFGSIGSVIETIFAALAPELEEAPPPPTPPFKGEGRAPDLPASRLDQPAPAEGGGARREPRPSPLRGGVRAGGEGAEVSERMRRQQASSEGRNYV